jgi:small conductance mechanosensitive channel
MNLDFSKVNWEEHSLTVGSALAVLVVGWIVASWLAAMVRRASERSGRISPTLVPLFAKLTRLTLLFVVVLAALGQLGIDTSGLFAMIGAAGLAIGLALKDTVADVAAGVVLLILRPFDVDEFVMIGGNGGQVKSIDIFETKLTSFEGVPLVINNSAVRSSLIQNFSRAQTRRTDLEIGIGYGDDIAKAIASIEAVLDADERVLKDPEKMVKVTSLGDSAVVILARYHTQAADFLTTKLDTTRAIKERLDQDGISIPFPQRDLHIVSGSAA